MKEPFGLRHNIVANFVGKAWSLLIGLVFVPLYIKFLGIESYGLIGIYASLTILLSVLDLGLSTTLNREMARLSAQTDTAKEMRDAVRTFELVYWIIGIFVGCVVIILAPWIAQNWLTGETLPISTIRQSVVLMGFVLALQWPTSLYSGALLGLQRQVLLNVVLIVFATVKALGAVLVLQFVQPTIQVFFSWQLFVTGLTTLAIVLCAWRALPAADGKAAFRKELLFSNWRFSLGLMGISMLVAILTQLDKVILSSRLTLEDFGFYSIASSVGVGLNFLVGPIFISLFPRFSQLISQGDQDSLKKLYHQACQLVSVSVLPLSATVIFFAPEILTVWLHEPAIVQNTQLLLSLIALGTTLNSLVNMPYALQLAYGWTRLSVYKNIIAVIILVPLLNLFIFWWGAIGAAVAWILLNAGYVFIEVPIMHTRFLRDSLRRWYLVDVGRPLAISFSIAGLSRWFFPQGLSMLGSVIWIFLTFSVVFFCSILAMPATRGWTQVIIENFGKNIRAHIEQVFRLGRM